MKVFITLKIVILTLFLTFNVYSQPNPDFDPNGAKFVAPPFRMELDAGDLSAVWDTILQTPVVASRSASALVTINGVKYIYQFGGGVDAQLTTVARYDFSTGLWSTNFASIPTALSGATAVVIGTDIYLFGGEYTAGLGKTYKYDAVNNSWTTLANMLTPVTDAAVLKYTDNLIYVIGGGNGMFATGVPYSNAVQLYNVATNSYSTATNFPISVGMMGIGSWYDTLICVGGYNGTKAVDTVFKGVINKNNPAQITWSGSKYPKYPAGPVTRPASVNIRFGNGAGVLFAGGAGNGVNSLYDAYYWDFNLLSWRKLPDLIIAKSNAKAVFSGDSVAYIIAGYTNQPTGRNDKITFKKIEGVSNNLNDFRLRYPANNSTVTSVLGSKLPVLFNWDSSGTGAIYKWSFEKDGAPATRMDTIIPGLNVFKISENDLDFFLAKKLNIAQGETVSGKWYVYAYKGPGAPGNRDSIPSDTLNVTFKRNKPTLSSFDLVAPVDNIRLSVSNLLTYPIDFVWTKAAHGASYKFYYFDSIRNKTLVLNSNGLGVDSNLQIKVSALDSIFRSAPWSLAQGDSTYGKWRVYAYSGSDSLVSAHSFNISFKRVANQLNSFSIFAPNNNDTIDVTNFSVVNFVWGKAAVGANYKWTFSTNANFSSPKQVLSNNNGYDTILTINTSNLNTLLGVNAGTVLKGYWRVFSSKGTDTLTSSNTFTIYLKRSANEQLLQRFTSLNCPPPNWNMEYSGTSSWSRVPFNAYFDTTITPAGCIKFDFYNTPKRTVQSFVTNVFPSSQSNDIGSDSLMFDYSHAYFGESNIDSLIIFYSTSDTGAITDTLPFTSAIPVILYSMTDFNNIQSLSTTTYQSGPYTPSNVNQWRSRKIGLPDGTRRIKFTAISGWGNNFYIDNIKLRNKIPILLNPTNNRIDVVHVIPFIWEATNIPSYSVFQVSTAADTFFTSPAAKTYNVGPGITTYTTDYTFLSYNYYRWRLKIGNDAGETPYTSPAVFFIDEPFAVYQKFIDTAFPPFQWRLENTDTTDLNYYWSRAQVGGDTSSNYAAKFDYFNAPYGKIRALITNTFPATGSGIESDYLTFDVAHAYTNNVNVDTMFIYGSQDYGNIGSYSKLSENSTWIGYIGPDTNIKSLSSTTLSGAPFTPSTALHWKRITIKLPPSLNRLKFECLSGNGNNLYITNVRVGKLQLELIPEAKTPTVYKLNTNYPNPFNPTTTISFSIPKTSLTKLVIYDVLGREISRLVNEVKNPGNYSVTFNAKNLASGVYFYRLEAGDFVDVKKMLLIK